MTAGSFNDLGISLPVRQMFDGTGYKNPKITGILDLLPVQTVDDSPHFFQVAVRTPDDHKIHIFRPPGVQQLIHFSLFPVGVHIGFQRFLTVKGHLKGMGFGGHPGNMK